MKNFKFFGDPRVILYTRRQLLLDFFTRFTAMPCFNNDGYPDALPDILARRNGLPDCLYDALAQVEQLAAAKVLKLEADFDRFPRATALTEALEDWLASHPAEEKQKVESRNQKTELESPSQTSDSSQAAVAAPGDGTEIENQKSEIENSLNLQPSTPDPSIHQSTNPSIQPVFPDEPATSASPGAEIENQKSKIENSISLLAQLSPVAYDQVRRAEAKRLNLRLRTLDDAVDQARSVLDDAEAGHILLSQTEPWPEPILDAPGLFDEVHHRAVLYLYLPPGAPVVFALWSGHAHAINAFTHSPRLNLTSAEPGCGKSTALDFLTPLCPRVLHTNNLKPPVLYRVMHHGRLTVFLDETDAYLQLYPELRGLLNAGNKPTSCVHRCEGNTVRVFRIYAATAIAGIGRLTPTLHHRSIVINCQEAPEGVLKARFNSEKAETETILGRKIARWAKDNFDRIAACDPVLPPKVHNRLADNWRPLFAVAQVIGGHWPNRITEAFHQIHSSSSPIPSFHHSNPSPITPPLHHSITPLLADLRLIFTQSGAQRLFSSALVDSLGALPDRPWSAVTLDNKSIKRITERWLSRQLRPVGVRPRTLRINGRKAKGYELADFLEAFAKHLAPPK